MVDYLRRRGITDAATLRALGAVPREVFVAAENRAEAYADQALSIGHGQSISQPYMVGRMTQALQVADVGWPWTSDAPTFLDIGTGSGYQAAILAELGARVLSIERNATLADEAGQRLARLGYVVDVLVGDGSAGAADRGPFGGIIVGAAAPAVPSPLVAQLVDGARLVVPVGSRTRQELMVVQRKGGGTQEETSDPCVFVPLVGTHGYPA
jgi:protein-L-isoaspartate(D-aspartate) O-methyltransferase